MTLTSDAATPVNTAPQRRDLADISSPLIAVGTAAAIRSELIAADLELQPEQAAFIQDEQIRNAGTGARSLKQGGRHLVARAAIGCCPMDRTRDETQLEMLRHSALQVVL
jgi:hypothetical protein